MSLIESPAVKDRVTALIELYAGDDLSVADLLCDRYPADTVAYTVLDEALEPHPLTYGSLRAASERLAAALAARGVGPGDRVATLMGKSRNYLVTLMAIWRLGAVHVPLFTAFGAGAVALRLSGSRAVAVVCDPGQRAKLDEPEVQALGCRILVNGTATGDDLALDALIASGATGFPAARRKAGDPFIQIYTSGTTGNPKGVLVPIRALAAFRAYAEFALDLRPDDVFWCAADPGWAYGLYFGVIATFSTGTPSLLLEGGFAAEKTLAVLAREGVTNFAAAPTVYRALRAAGDAPDRASLRLRCASSAGEPLTPEVNDWARDALGLAVHDHYGQTEAGMLINNHHAPALRRPIRAGSMGQVMPGWTGAVLHDTLDEPVPVGERGRVAMDLSLSPLAWFAGYDDNPEKSAEKFSADGRWYLTGDTGSVDADGYFTFSARDDDVIIMAGYRIGPFEVESVMLTHPAVAEAAVIAAPDAVRGEVIEAYVVLEPAFEASPALAAEIQTWVKTRYAAHAYPRQVHFIAALPKTPSGKVQRFVLKTQRRGALAGAAPA